MGILQATKKSPGPFQGKNLPLPCRALFLLFVVVYAPITAHTYGEPVGTGTAMGAGSVNASFGTRTSAAAAARPVTPQIVHTVR